MKVLVVGGGGREHALAWKLFASPRVEGLVCAPGNAGTALLARAGEAEATDLPALAALAEGLGIDLTVVGPETPLALGIVDLFQERGLAIFGPTRAAAQLESSKVWAKTFLQRHALPTARAEVVESEAEARAALARFGYPVVVKADGLASGKGVWVLGDDASVEPTFEALFNRRSLGDAGDRLLIEEHLRGRELSVLAFTDGERLAVMPPARDYKRLGDGDSGPNTGGMGGYTRPADATPELMARVEAEILRPTIGAMAADGHPFQGVLYAGLMLTADGPKVLEFNARFGDPEAQLILPLLESDLLETCLSVVEGRLDPAGVRWGGGATCGVVLASAGYPEAPRLGVPIEGLEDLDPGVLAFHGGTRAQVSGGLFRSGRRSIVASGGRVVTVVATGTSVASARLLVYENLPRITFSGMVYRTDIGHEPADPLPPAAGSVRAGAPTDPSPPSLESAPASAAASPSDVAASSGATAVDRPPAAVPTPGGQAAKATASGEQVPQTLLPLLAEAVDLLLEDAAARRHDELGFQAGRLRQRLAALREGTREGPPEGSGR